MTKTIKQAQQVLWLAFGGALMLRLIEMGAVQMFIEPLVQTEEQLNLILLVLVAGLLMLFNLLAMGCIILAARMKHKRAKARFMLWITAASLFLTCVQLYYLNGQVDLGLIAIIASTYYLVKQDYATFVLNDIIHNEMAMLYEQEVEDNEDDMHK